MIPQSGGRSALGEDYPRLVDGRTGQSFWLTKDIVLIGRHRSCDIIVPVVEVSRRHCRIYIDDGVYYVEDLRTVNGTFVNEKVIHGPQLLQDGFHLKVARCSKYPAGVKNYIFRLPAKLMKKHDSSHLDEETRSLRRDLLTELTDGEDIGQKKKKIVKVELKHCILKIVRGKRGQPYQAPLVRWGNGEIGFLSLSEVAVGEQVQMTLSHPSWREDIPFAAKVQRVGKIKDRPVQQVEAAVEIDDEAQQTFDKHVAPGGLIKYFA